MTIRADEIDVSGQSSDGLFSSGIISGSQTRANAGTVILVGNQIAIRDGEGVSVNSLNGAAAGNLTVVTERLSLNDGTLQAKVTESSGSLNITATEAILLRQNSSINDITASSQFGINGTVS